MQKLKRIKRFLKGLIAQLIPWSKIKVILIVSTGRTGTEFIAHLLNKEFFDKVSAYHEPQPDLHHLYIHHLKNNYPLEYLKKEIRTLRAIRVLKCFLQGKLYVESNNNWSFLLHSAPHVFPNLKIVYVVRHVKSFLKSEMNKKHGRMKFDFYGENDPRERVNPSLITSHFSKYIDWDTASREEKIIWYWVICNVTIEKYLHESQGDKMIVRKSRFEALFNNHFDLKEMRNLLLFIDENLRIEDMTLIAAMKKKKNSSKEEIFNFELLDQKIKQLVKKADDTYKSYEKFGVI